MPVSELVKHSQSGNSEKANNLDPKDFSDSLDKDRALDLHAAGKSLDTRKMPYFLNVLWGISAALV